MTVQGDCQRLQDKSLTLLNIVLNCRRMYFNLLDFRIYFVRKIFGYAITAPLLFYHMTQCFYIHLVINIGKCLTMCFKVALCFCFFFLFLDMFSLIRPLNLVTISTIPRNVLSSVRVLCAKMCECTC